MENVISTEAATIKKKRNRSQRKPKSNTGKSTEQPIKTNAVEQVSAHKNESNLPSASPRGSVDKGQRQSAAKEQVIDAGQLNRKPSQRRKRKPKSAKETTDNATVLESRTIENTQSIETGDPRDKPRLRKIFQEIIPDSTTVENISIEKVFPSSNVFSFHQSYYRFGKLNTPEPLAERVAKTEQQVPDNSLYVNLGLQDINPEDVFPSNPLVGLKLISPAVVTPTLEENNSNQQLENTETMSARPEKTDKTREEILAEREAKKAAKLSAKNKNKDKTVLPQAAQQQKQQPTKASDSPKAPVELSKSGTDGSICEKLKELHISDGPVKKEKSDAKTATQPDSVVTGESKELTKAERKAQFEAKNLSLTKKGTEGAKPTLTKAERRAIQEAQRAAKAEAQQIKKRDQAPTSGDVTKKNAANQPKSNKTATQAVKKSVTLGVVGAGGPPRKHIVNLFNHLYQPKFAAAEIVNSPSLHPAVTKLGIQYAEGSVVGSKARCLALLKMLNLLIHDYETPPEKEFGRSFEETLNTSASFLQRCRPFSVSMTNALRHVKMYARQLDSKVSVSEQKEFLLESIESYIRDQIEKAEEAICISVQEKIFDGDVILTYGCSSLIKHILEEANRRSKNFRVIIVNARPREEEHAMLEQLVQQGVKCTCVLINAVSYVMPEVTKVLLGAHALLANGSVMSRVGTAQIALVAKSYNVPVLVCCETHKFTERVQTDAFVYNEIGNPNDLVLPPRTRDLSETKPMLAGWETLTSLTILNLHYDVTPPELVTAVVTEVAILPCTSVPVILRIKPSDVTY
ncbi:translation initiation factor eIF-2B subunit delta [Anopheles ziemanni]|uniref:translation initiation factor eIF-2B subunit delta n=1 Tax=Anopheles coustani TaxID=139045 RepID=UPI0026596E43|nr:translation initiation factor eIF-2B subunit delta [Anopheles coustani]XP_058177532.1 translation initiation factor eIF-2B subunit delta [Anopheles ziemanni]